MSDTDATTPDGQPSSTSSEAPCAHPLYTMSIMADSAKCETCGHIIDADEGRRLGLF